MNKKDNKFSMVRCGIIITYRCNLKCKLCTAYSPYYDIPPHFPYEKLEKSIDSFFKIVTYTGKFTVTGGEPLLHKDLPKIIAYILNFAEQFGELEIITNGTMIPSEELLCVIRSNSKIKFLVDDYGEISTNVKNIRNIFNENKINYVIRGNNINDAYCGGWIDYGDFSKKLFTKEAVEELFSRCISPQKMNFCFAIKNGEIHPCGASSRCMELNIIPKNEEEYIDLFDESLTIEEQRNKIKGIQNTNSLTACAYCNGFCEDSPRFPPAEQLE